MSASDRSGPDSLSRCALAALALLLLSLGCRGTRNPAPSGVDRRFATTDQVPQTIRIDGGRAFVVNSGSNNIQRIDLASSANSKSFVRFDNPDGEPPANPWGLSLYREGGRLLGLVSGNLSGRVYIVDLDSGVVEARLSETFDAPQFVLVDGALGFVANTAYRYPSWGEGSLSVVDLASRRVVRQLATCGRNPQSLLVAGEWLVVVSSGTLVERDGRFLPGEGGCLDFFSRAEIANASAPAFRLMVPPSRTRPEVGAPIDAALAPGGRWLYLSSATSATLFVVDLESRSLVRGAENPIRLADSDHNELLSIRSHPGGWLVVLRYNTDELLLVAPDPNDASPVRTAIDLGESPSQLEGPVDLAFAGERAYVLMGISNRVVEIDLSAYPAPR